MIPTPNKSDRLELTDNLDTLKDHIARSKVWLNPPTSFQ